MTRRAVAIVMLLVLLSGGMLAGPRPVQSAGDPVYIALGDSIAAGIGTSLPRDRGYPALVRDLLARHAGQDVTLEALAVPGETAASFRNAGQLERYRALVDRLGRGDTTIAAITVSLGGNEMLRVSGNGSVDRQAALDEFQATFPAALADIRAAAGPNVPIVVTTYYDLSSGDASVVESDAWWLSRFNQVIADAAAASGARVADVAGTFAGQIDAYTLAPVDVHPTNSGHQAIADAVWRALESDTSAPVIDVASSLDATRMTPTLRFAISDDTGVTEVDVASDDAIVFGPFADGVDWVVLVDLHGSDGPVSVSIRATDAAGNTATQNVSVNPPATAP